MSSINIRAAIYARISHDPAKANGADQPSKGGDGLGVARQEQDCRELAARLHLQVIEVFVDNDTSAYSGKRRSGFEAMLDAMKNNWFDTLIYWQTDRLYRSMKDLERLIDVAELARVPILTVVGGELDLSTSAGRMVARILGSVARQESEHMSERRIRANRQKAEAVKWQSANRTFGYTMKGEPLEPEASAVRKAAIDVLAGESIQGVAREWKAAGLVSTPGRPFNSPSVRRLLVNPRYVARARVLRDESHCGICRFEADKTLSSPHPLRLRLPRSCRSSGAVTRSTARIAASVTACAIAAWATGCTRATALPAKQDQPYDGLTSPPEPGDAGLGPFSGVTSRVNPRSARKLRREPTVPPACP